MKRFTTLFIYLSLSLAGIAQNVGIGTSTPNASALLELQSTNKGLLLPRVADTNAIASPAKGLVIFSTTANALFYYNGSSWQSTANSGSGNGNIWQASGDTATFTSRKHAGINHDYTIYPQRQGIQASGSLFMHQDMLYTKQTPTAAQTQNMNNLSAEYNWPASDSTGRIFDPGGSNTNYINNSQGNISILSNVVITFNPSDFGIAAGDTLWISRLDFPSCRTNFIAMYTNTNTVPTQLTSASVCKIIFRSNGDNINGKGFDITFKKLYAKIVTEPATQPVGNALLFDAVNGSLRAGFIGYNSKIGDQSIALGYNNDASGTSSISIGNGNNASEYSMALGIANTTEGINTTAIGVSCYSKENATTLGYQADAWGNHSTAIGYRSRALGGYSYSIGQDNNATGDFSFALGSSSKAIGTYSNAFGNSATAKGWSSMAIGNNATTEGMYSTAIGDNTVALSKVSTALGSYNDTFPGTSKTNWINTDPLVYFGNGQSSSTRSNAMVIYKNADVDINGYTRLGKLSEGAPVIKMKKFTGTSSSSQNGFTDVTHGVNRAKIIGIQVIMKLPGFVDLGPGSRVNTGYEYEFQILDSIIRIANVNGNSVNILNKNFVVLVTYEE